MKSVRFGPFSGLYFPVFGLSEYGKIQTIETSNMETFYAVTLSIKRDQLRKKELQNSKVCVKFESVYYSKVCITPSYFTSIQD